MASVMQYGGGFGVTSQSGAVAATNPQQLLGEPRQGEGHDSSCPRVFAAVFLSSPGVLVAMASAAQAGLSFNGID